MKQYRITSADIMQDTSDEECVLSDADKDLVASHMAPTAKIGFDEDNPTLSSSTVDAEGT